MEWICISICSHFNELISIINTFSGYIIQLLSKQSDQVQDENGMKLFFNNFFSFFLLLLLFFRVYFQLYHKPTLTRFIFPTTSCNNNLNAFLVKSLLLNIDIDTFVFLVCYNSKIWHNFVNIFSSFHYFHLVWIMKITCNNVAMFYDIYIVIDTGLEEKN